MKSNLCINPVNLCGENHCVGLQTVTFQYSLAHKLACLHVPPLNMYVVWTGASSQVVTYSVGSHVDSVEPQYVSLGACQPSPRAAAKQRGQNLREIRGKVEGNL